MKEKKLLIIYYNFPPVKVPGAVRIKKIHDYSCFHFQNTFVISTSNRKYFPKDELLETPTENLYEVPAYDLRFFSQNIHANRQEKLDSYKKKTGYSFFRRLLDSFPFNIIIGDGGLFYILFAYLKAKELVNSHGITHVITSFRPYSDHIVAFLLKRKFPNLYWIADFRDLHLDEKMGRKLFFWSFQITMNRLIISKANQLTTVSKGLTDKLKPFHPNIRILPNGIASSGNSIDRASDIFYISYTGRIYPGEQKSILLFECVKTLIDDNKIDANKIRLRYAGPTPSLWLGWGKKTGLAHITENKGFVSLEASRKIQQESALNLSLSFSSSTQKGDISSKIYEYLASSRPILVIVNGEQDKELEKFVEHLETGKLIYHKKEEKDKMKDFIFELYSKWETGHIEPYPKNRAAYQNMLSSTIFNQFYHQLLQS
jgi:hypothetical protein